MKIRLLIAEDDADIRRGLEATLESEGYEVISAHDGEQAVKLARQLEPALIVLDVMMPKLSGFDACKQLRGAGVTVPILLLTAKSEEIDKVVGLKLGADDYVTKPFGVHELLARVEALLRRSRRDAAGGSVGADDLPATFRIGEATIDRRTYTVERGGVVQTLTKRELKLLELLVARRGEVLTRDELLNGAWGIDYYGTTRTLDQHIAQVRKKIEAHPEAPQWIETRHGLGYRLVPAAGL